MESGSDSESKAESEEEDDDVKNARSTVPKLDSDSDSDESVKKPSRGRKPGRRPGFVPVAGPFYGCVCIFVLRVSFCHQIFGHVFMKYFPQQTPSTLAKLFFPC